LILIKKEPTKPQTHAMLAWAPEVRKLALQAADGVRRLDGTISEECAWRNFMDVFTNYLGIAGTTANRHFFGMGFYTPNFYFQE